MIDNFDDMKKEELRNACRTAGLSYRLMTNEHIRYMLREYYGLSHPDKWESAPIKVNPFIRLFKSITFPNSIKGTIYIDGMIKK